MESKNQPIQLIRICFTNRFNFFLFWRLLIKCSGNDFFFASYMLLHPNTAQKCRRTHSIMTFHWEFFLKAQCVVMIYFTTHLFSSRDFSTSSPSSFPHPYYRSVTAKYQKTVKTRYTPKFRMRNKPKISRLGPGHRVRTYLSSLARRFPKYAR